MRSASIYILVFRAHTYRQTLRAYARVAGGVMCTNVNAVTFSHKTSGKMHIWFIHLFYRSNILKYAIFAMYFNVLLLFTYSRSLCVRAKVNEICHTQSSAYHSPPPVPAASPIHPTEATWSRAVHRIYICVRCYLAHEEYGNKTLVRKPTQMPEAINEWIHSLYIFHHLRKFNQMPSTNKAYHWNGNNVYKNISFDCFLLLLGILTHLPICKIDITLPSHWLLRRIPPNGMICNYNCFQQL